MLSNLVAIYATYFAVKKNKFLQEERKMKALNLTTLKTRRLWGLIEMFKILKRFDKSSLNIVTSQQMDLVSIVPVFSFWLITALFRQEAKLPG